MRWPILLVALALAACGPKANDGPTPPAPERAASDFSKPMDAHGTEPFWALTIREGTLTLTRPDHPILVARAPGAVIHPETASWTGKLPDGAEMKVTLYGSPCTDAMSGRSFAYAAEVVLPGQPPLNGCADKTSVMAAKPPAG